MREVSLSAFVNLMYRTLQHFFKTYNNLSVQFTSMLATNTGLAAKILARIVVLGTQQPFTLLDKTRRLLQSNKNFGVVRIELALYRQCHLSVVHIVSHVISHSVAASFQRFVINMLFGSSG